MVTPSSRGAAELWPTPSNPTSAERGAGSAAESVHVWKVGALCRAIADVLDARLNPVAVTGEISGFSRPASGHCYFSLKDASGQLRCAMFRRAASGLDFAPRDGELVEVRGRLGVYEPRGELQLVVESMRRAGQGNLFEQFLQVKARLEAQGLFDAARKRLPGDHPRAIGVVTSLAAAAWHDVMTALQRRVPHIPVVIAPALVQGDSAPRELIAALRSLYALIESGAVAIDTILLVRGGGAMEDLWAFNDEQLAYTIAQSPVPVVSGVGHETDFTIADFVADLRAPTPTAAAELAARTQQSFAMDLDAAQEALGRLLLRRLDREAQYLDSLALRMGRPAAVLGQQSTRLSSLEQRLGHALRMDLQQRHQRLENAAGNLRRAVLAHPQRLTEQQARMGLRLAAVNPALVLQRGYAWMATSDGRPVTSTANLSAGQALVASLADGTVDLTVHSVKRN